jgi:DNA-binding CsgD family transcriptional regulator
VDRQEDLPAQVESRLHAVREAFSAQYDRLCALVGELVSACGRRAARDTPTNLAVFGRLPQQWTSLDLVAPAQGLRWLAGLARTGPRTRVLCDAGTLCGGAFDTARALLDRGIPVRVSDRPLAGLAVLNGSRTFILCAGDAGEPAVVEQPGVARAFAGVYEVLWGSAARLDAPAWATDLTTAQHKVLQLLRVGLSDQEIARAVGTTPQAVRLHLGAIRSRLGATTRLSAGVAAARLEAGERDARAPNPVRS